MGEGAELRPSLDFGLEQRNEDVTGYLLVFLGGGLGSTLRHIINMVSARLLGTAFPYHTFIINITGSTVMGLIAGYLAFKGEASQPWRLFLMTGILGVLARCSIAVREGRDRACGAVCGRIGRAFDCRPVRRPRAGAPLGLNLRLRMAPHGLRMGMA